MFDAPSDWSSDRGTTLTEVLVVLAISALVVPSLYVAVVSGFREERSQEAAQVSESQVQRVSARLVEDVNEHWASDKRSGDPAGELSLAVVDTDGTLSRVFWYVDGSSLVRLVIDDASGRTESKVELLTALEVKGPVFRYWTADGREITDGKRLASCAVRVTVNLRTVDDGDEASTEFNVSHRLRDPEAEPC